MSVDTTPDPAPATTAQPLELSSDMMIGRFELIRELARGGMGQVFLGRDTKLGRRVAIKFLLRSDPTFVQRFLIEARATASCTHDNIITIFEVGEHRGLPYMVLEYLEGQTLSEVIATKPTVRQFVELMLPVARALERAHEHGIVHRDLKPSNIFVTTRGQVKVLDFGVARIINTSESEIVRATAAMRAIDPSELSEPALTGPALTGNDAIVGTLPYMSPEQWGADEIDTLTDIWAFGIMFWRALTGMHPAGSCTPPALQFRLRSVDIPLPSIADAAPTLPRALIEIVDRCLAMRKRDRYQSAADVVRDLERVLLPQHDDVGGRAPFRGLASFGERDAEYFFGRSNEVRSAVAHLESWPVLAVIGPSGVGKSSFVHAGLIPALRAHHDEITVRVLRPGRAPLQRLAEALGDQAATPPHALAASLLDAPGQLGVELRRVAASHAHHVVIVVDQLEELFTLCDDPRARHAFLAALIGAADDPSAPIRVVMAMRADFLDRLAGQGEFVELSRALFFLAQPEREGLHEALVRPAQLAGYTYETSDIVDEMVMQATSGGALPLIAFAANRLWEARDRQRHMLTLRAYVEMGGVGGAFARHADQVAAAIPSQHQRLLRTVLLRLVTPEGTRAVVDRDELASIAASPRDIETVLDHLARARLIHTHADHERGATVELVHEALISQWPTLKRWLDEGHATRAFAHELGLAARQWIARGKPDDLVWRGTMARDALDHAERDVLELSTVERELLAAIRSHATRARHRKLAAVLAAAALAGILVAVGSVALIRIKRSEERAIASEKQAQNEASQAKQERAAAVAAKADLQTQLQLVAEKERARVEAEQRMTAANATVEQYSGQIAEQNKALSRALAEAQAARAKAEKSSVEATAAKEVLQRMLDKEREKLKALERSKSELIKSLDK